MYSSLREPDASPESETPARNSKGKSNFPFSLFSPPAAWLLSPSFQSNHILQIHPDLPTVGHRPCALWMNLTSYSALVALLRCSPLAFVLLNTFGCLYTFPISVSSCTYFLELEVPQNAVLGSLMFSLFTPPLGTLTLLLFQASLCTDDSLIPVPRPLFQASASADQPPATHPHLDGPRCLRLGLAPP